MKGLQNPRPKEREKYVLVQHVPLWSSIVQTTPPHEKEHRCVEYTTFCPQMSLRCVPSLLLFASACFRRNHTRPCLLN